MLMALQPSFASADGVSAVDDVDVWLLFLPAPARVTCGKTKERILKQIFQTLPGL
jgi:hypothetical protein